MFSRHCHTECDLEDKFSLTTFTTHLACLIILGRQDSWYSSYKCPNVTTLNSDHLDGKWEHQGSRTMRTHHYLLLPSLPPSLLLFLLWNKLVNWRGVLIGSMILSFLHFILSWYTYHTRKKTKQNQNHILKIVQWKKSHLLALQIIKQTEKSENPREESKTL